jgi:hypothetical protein
MLERTAILLEWISQTNSPSTRASICGGRRHTTAPALDRWRRNAYPRLRGGSATYRASGGGETVRQAFFMRTTSPTRGQASEFFSKGFRRIST